MGKYWLGRQEAEKRFSGERRVVRTFSDLFDDVVVAFAVTVGGVHAGTYDKDEAIKHARELRDVKGRKDVRIKRVKV